MNVQVGGHLDDVPGPGLPVVGEVHVVLVVEETEADLVAGEGPGAELHDAGLLVEGEVRHVNCAGGLQREETFKNRYRVKTSAVSEASGGSSRENCTALYRIL